MSAQYYNPKVAAIFGALSCRTNPGCACVANLSKPSGLTHCPVCGNVSLVGGGGRGED